MQATTLETRRVAKPWGRTDLPAPFGGDQGERIGEIWFAGDDTNDLPLLLKYIFTSERLSIQVHPNDEQARELGLRSGKNECWYILDAAPDAMLGLGLKEPADRETLRAAALDGSIEQMIDWRAAQRGDVVYVPAGTIHAIGGGISLVEIQQNVDVTYRLYDYGRPRELHLDEGLRAAKPLPYPEDFTSRSSEEGSRVLVNVAQFTLLRLVGGGAEAEPLVDRDRWVLPLAGTATSNAVSVNPGGCLLVPAREPLEISEDATVLVAAAGPIA